MTQTADGLLLDWRTPPVVISTTAEGTVTVSIAGFSVQGRPGSPLLPTGAALVALPPGAAPALRLILEEEQVVAIPGPIAAAPLPSTNGFGEPLDFPWLLNSVSPTESVRLDDLGVVRGNHLVRVMFYPARPEGNDLRLTTHVQVAVDFDAPASGLGASESLYTDPVLDVIREAVVNPGQVSPLPANPPQPAVTQADAAPVAAVEVTTPGVTAITYEALLAAGFPVTTTDPSLLHLTRRTGTLSQEVALQWAGSAITTTFQPGDRLLFYAAPRFSRWATTDTYFLSQEATEGQRMQSQSGAPAGLPAGAPVEQRTAEVNALYLPYCWCGALPPGRDGDRWAWDELKFGSHPSGNYPLTLSAVDTTKPATLTVWLIGGTDVAAAPDHRVNITLNGSAVLTQAIWNGKTAYTATVAIGTGVLSNGANTLGLTLPGIPGGIERAWLDAFSLTYARSSAISGQAASFMGEAGRHAYTLGLSSTSSLRAYDITDEAHPAALTDFETTTSSVTIGDPDSGLPRRYAVAAAAGLLSPARVRLVAPSTATPGADYLIITHPDFAPALPDLASLRATQGNGVTVESVQAIYDAYDGRPEPEAIRAYLQTAFNTWRPPPAYVLLVGDGTLDPKRYLSTSSATFIPPYLADADFGGGETAADNQYVAWGGIGSLPSMLIGRLPVNTLAEAQAVVGKIVRYDTQPWPGDWNSRANLVAGNPLAQEYPATYFHQEADTAATHLPPSIAGQRLYFNASDSQTTAKQRVQQAWNWGASVMMYVGHASWHQWNASPILFHYSDVPGLTNGGWQPVLLEMTCFTGFFHRPDMGTLDEAMLRHPGGGAVAVWGSSGLGLPSGHDELAAGFLDNVYQPDVTLGQAAFIGKSRLLASLDLRDTYTLFGDPAMSLNTTLRPWPVHIYLPAVRR